MTNDVGINYRVLIDVRPDPDAVMIGRDVYFRNRGPLPNPALQTAVLKAKCAATLKECRMN